MAGFVAENIILERMVPAYWSDVADMSGTDVLLDVRTVQEFEKGSIPGAINIPVDELRSRLDELPEDRKIYAFCQVGLRGYLAQRILMQNGFSKVRNISGGYTTWSACDAEQKHISSMAVVI